MSAIKVKNLKKYYKVRQKDPGIKGSVKSLFSNSFEIVKAVDGISFNISEGELIGFIGPNGAGKTTTLKCLSGLLHPTSGSIETLGFNPWEKKTEFKRQISLVMGQKNQLWWDLPAMDSFLLNKAIYGVEDDKFKKVLSELTSLLEIEGVLSTPIRKLSLGQRMKCEFIGSLLHSPRLLLLDEPTIGLDVVSQKNIRDFIKDYNKKYNSTVILTSHNMEDVKKLCKRVMIIDKGKLVYDGTLDNISKRFSQSKKITVVFSKKENLEKISKIVKVKEVDSSKFIFNVKRNQVSSVVSKILNDFSVVDLSIEEPPIEDVIRDLFVGKNYA